MNCSVKYLFAIFLALCLVADHDLFARGFGGGGRGGGGGMSRGGGGASMSRGGASMSRGGASASRGGASASRGGASASRGGATASRGGATASRGGATASRGGTTASRGGTTASRGGGSISTSSGRTAAGTGGSQSYTGPRGGSVTVGGAGGAVSGPRGDAAGRVGGVKVETAGGNTATKGGAGGVARGESGVVAGQARGGSVSGSRGSVSGGQARAAGRNMSTDAGFAKYRGGVSVRGGSGGSVHRTRSVTATTRHQQGVAVRNNVGVRYGGRGAWYSNSWYAKYPNAWRAGRWTAAAAWTAASWNTLTNWWGPSYASQPVYYDYGNTIVYEGDTVYSGGEQVASADVYYDQASEIAQAGSQEVNDEEDWMSLGVWAMVQGDQTESNNILQLAVNKEGIIRGNHYNALHDTTEPIQGSVDRETQRAAWTVGENGKVVSETGIFNLTKDETEMLVHYGQDKTEQWTLVRLEEPEGESGEG